MPTQVKGSVDKRGVVRGAHIAARRKKIDAPPQPTRIESNLDKFIVSHGGADHMRKTLQDMTPEQQAKLIDAMAYVGGVDHGAVLDKLGMRKPPAEERGKLVERLGRGVAGGYINEAESQAVLETYDKSGSAVALESLRGILRAKKEAAAQPAATAPEPPAATPTEATSVPAVLDKIKNMAGHGLAGENVDPMEAGLHYKDGKDFVQGPKTIKLKKNNFEVKRLPLANLNAKQGYLVRDKLSDMVKLVASGHKFEGKPAEVRPTVVESNGEYFIQDGHHRVAAAALLGQSDVEVNVIHAEGAPDQSSNGPQEGDTKTEDGIEYVLRDGRWHRVTETAAAVTEPTAAVTEMPEAVTEVPLPVREDEPAPGAPAPDGSEDGDDLDPNSPNYRYRDTGYIGGSRKEEAAKMIRRMAKDGQQVRVTDIDWDQIEQNPREAADLITKKNIFGEVDWMALRDAGVEPGAGFLLQKVYAAVAPDPAIDSALGRHDYAQGIESLRNRLEACKTVDEVAKTLDEIQDERDGIILTPEEQVQYEALSADARAEYESVRKIDATADEMYKTYITASTVSSRLKFDIEKREIRKWKVPDEMRANLISAQAETEKAMDAWRKYREEQGMEAIAHKTKTSQGIATNFEYPYKNKYVEASRKRGELRQQIQARNLVENPVTRAWNSLGESFNAVVNYRRHKGSEAFARHLASAKAGRVKNWDWAEKKAEPRKASKRSTTFQLRVADTFERVGGRAIAVDSTSSLKEHFGLREVQSGNWVLDDPNSAKFHVESCANAFADMADVLGIPDAQASFNGRLAMAFGARGRGNAGGSAAKAHYEPIERVINLTKMAGGGSLAHEWFHMVDNLVKEATTGVGSSVDDFATENAGMLDDPRLKGAFSDLTKAMMSGPHRRITTLQYTETEEKMAQRTMQAHYSGSIRDRIRSAANVQEAIDRVESMYQSGAFGAVDKKKSKASRDTWRKIAAVHHGGNDAREVSYETGPGMSMFAMESVSLDQGSSGKYWSSPREMAARAFSSYMQDKLEGSGRRNTYLVSMADNDAYKMLGEPSRPFPEGAERDRINGAFEKLFTVLREHDTLAKALALVEAA